MEALALGCGSVLQFDLTHGFVAVVDADRFESTLNYQWLNGQRATLRPSSLTWFSKMSNSRWYATAAFRVDEHKLQAKLHRLIAEAPFDMLVDHISGDTMDNRLANLRLCTAAQNRFNAPHRSGVRSGFKGVVKSPSGRFAAQLTIDNKAFRLGSFGTAEAAARAYDRAAIEHFGEFARLNFPIEAAGS